MRKYITLILLLILFIFSVFLLRLNEDEWICENGEWVKHGNPLATIPTTPCAPVETPQKFIDFEEKLIGGEKDEGGCLISAGYSWCEIKQKCVRVWEEPCTIIDEKNNIENIILDLEEQTDISMNRLGKGTFQWNQKTPSGNVSMDVSGYGYSAILIDNSKETGIVNFFKEQEFVNDPANVSAGVIESTAGYVRENLSCLYSKTFSDYKEGDTQLIPNSNSTLDITIYCGYILE